jgi:ATP-dependent Clp protease adaptor protein ClpS
MVQEQTLPAPVETTESETRVRLAPQWKVLFHNDEITTMDFVVSALMRYYGHSFVEAYRIMMTVHTSGVGLAGVYPREVAELKQEQTISAARPTYPLQVTIEPDE